MSHSLVFSRCTRRACLWGGAASLLGLTAGCHPGGGAGVSAMDVSGAPWGRDFRLQDTTGRWRTLADYRGKLVLMFFGFTQCPDICPAALMRAVELLPLLGDDGSRVQVLFVSLDPERDSAEILAAYIGSFHPRFAALRGDVELTRSTAEHYKVSYRKVPLAGSYTIDHSALVYAYDPGGRLRLALRPELTAAEQATALRPLLASATAAPHPQTPSIPG